jgi:hypothetical protein
MARALVAPIATAFLAAFLSVASTPASAQTPDGGAAPAADAKSPISAEVIILHATNEGTGIDPKIGKMPELANPPFSSYNSYKLLDRPKVQLFKGRHAQTKLPNSRDLKITIKDEPAVKDGEPKKYVISASIQKADGNAFLPLLEVTAKAGDTFFVAGQKHGSGILVIGIKLVAN